MISIEDIWQAASRIQGKVVPTSTILSPGLSESFGLLTYMKLENLQYSGSFKPRGVLNKLLQLPEAECQRKMMAASGGNFEIALAEVGAQLGVDVTIVLPRSVAKESASRIQSTGAAVVWEDTVSDAFSRADQMAAAGYLLIDDCDDIENVRDDRFFIRALGIEQMPSGARLRQRFDEDAQALIPLIDEACVDFIRTSGAPFTALPMGHVALEMDGFPMNNSLTKKRRVTYLQGS